MSELYYAENLKINNSELRLILLDHITYIKQAKHRFILWSDTFVLSSIFKPSIYIFGNSDLFSSTVNYAFWTKARVIWKNIKCKEKKGVSQIYALWLFSAHSVLVFKAFSGFKKCQNIPPLPPFVVKLPQHIVLYLLTLCGCTIIDTKCKTCNP